MRAQKVNENINFERGEDPKVTMDIGLPKCKICGKIFKEEERKLKSTDDKLVCMRCDNIAWEEWKRQRKEQQVNENINFERGLDPITSMGIGKEWTIEDLMDIYKELLIRTIQTEYRKPFIKEIHDFIPSRYRTRVGWGNLDHIMLILDEDEFEKIKNIILKYYNQIKKK